MTIKNGYVTDNVKWVLRIEGLLVLAVASIFYNNLGTSWQSFALWFFVPDLSFIGYVASKKIGAICYNIMHSYITPLLFAFLLTLNEVSNWQYLVLIWVAHIGFDRMLGYGLKYSAGFTYTHLGLIGKWN